MAKRTLKSEPENNTGSLPPAGSPAGSLEPDRKQDIINALNGYRTEAENARRSGLNPRDAKWEDNLDLYWNRTDFSRKASWQAKETMPEVPSYVDRFAAALKEALVSVPGGFYTINDPLDKEHDLTNKIKTLSDYWLSMSGRNPNGIPLDFSSVFEEEVKLGALTAMCSVTTWKKDMQNGAGRVSIDPVDPRFFWMDHTGRNLYRFRRIELDAIDLIKMLDKKDKKGNAIFHQDQLEQAIQGNGAAAGTTPYLDEQRKREMSGSGTEITSTRRPYIMEEWVATVVDSEGKLIEDEHSLYNTLNGQYVIRGPEKNPYMHGNDWVTFAPMITAPLSPYGRTYMEDFGSVAKTFTEMTNLILDAAHTSALNAFAVVTEALENPEALAGGITPNLLLKIDAAFDPNKVLVSVPLGKLDSGAVQVWQALKKELSEAAGINEIGLGQLPDKTHISASASESADSNSSAMIRGVSQTIESRWLNPTLDNSWKTGMQFEDFSNPRIRAAIGEQTADMFKAQRKQFIQRPMAFQANGISMMIRKKQVFNELTQLMQVIGQNQQLAQLFMQKTDLNLFINMLFELSGIDPEKIGMSARAQAIQSIVNPLQAAGGPGIGEQPGVAANLNQLSSQMGAA